MFLFLFISDLHCISLFQPWNDFLVSIYWIWCLLQPGQFCFLSSFFTVNFQTRLNLFYFPFQPWTFFIFFLSFPLLLHWLFHMNWAHCSSTTLHRLLQVLPWISTMFWTWISHYIKSTPGSDNKYYVKFYNKNCRRRGYFPPCETTTVNCLYHSLCYHGNHNNVVMTTIRSDNN